MDKPSIRQGKRSTSELEKTEVISKKWKPIERTTNLHNLVKIDHSTKSNSKLRVRVRSNPIQEAIKEREMIFERVGSTRKQTSRLISKNPILRNESEGVFNIIPLSLQNEENNRNLLNLMQFKIEDKFEYSLDYLQEILNAMKVKENSLGINPDYMKMMQTNINPEHREKLVDWLLDINDYFHFTSETLFLAIHYLDRYLSKQVFTKVYLQLLGLVCLWIAAKMEETNFYDPMELIKELIRMTMDSFTVDEAINVEKLVLYAIQWNLVVPTPDFFLKYFSKVIDVDEQTIYFSMFSCEAFMVDYRSIKYSPSLIASASLALAMYTITLNNQTSYSNSKKKVLEECSGWSFCNTEFVGCIKHLLQFLGSPNPQLDSLKLKYSKQQYLGVSKIPLPLSFSSEFLRL